jgi:hypothetical protein
MDIISIVRSQLCSTGEILFTLFCVIELDRREVPEHQTYDTLKDEQIRINIVLGVRDTDESHRYRVQNRWLETCQSVSLFIRSNSTSKEHVVGFDGSISNTYVMALSNARLSLTSGRKRKQKGQRLSRIDDIDLDYWIAFYCKHIVLAVRSRSMLIECHRS